MEIVMSPRVRGVNLEHAKIPSLLVALGVDIKVAYVHSDKLRRKTTRSSVDRLGGPDIIAWLARDAYRRAVKGCHPDTSQGDLDKFVHLQAVKARLSRILLTYGVRL